MSARLKGILLGAALLATGCSSWRSGSLQEQATSVLSEGALRTTPEPVVADRLGSSPGKAPAGSLSVSTTVVGGRASQPDSSVQKDEWEAHGGFGAERSLEVRAEYYKYLREYKFTQNAEMLGAMTRRQGHVGLLRALHGGALIDCGRDKEGAEELAAALRLEPRSALAFVFKGNLSAFTGRLDEAGKHYRHACALASTSFDRSIAQSALGNFYFWQGNLGRARLYYEWALSAASDFSILRGRLYQQLALVAELEQKPTRVRELLRKGYLDERKMGPFAQLVEYSLVTGQPHLVDEQVLGTLPKEEGHSRGLLYYTNRLLVRRDLQLGLVDRALRKGYPVFANLRGCYPTDLVRLVRLNLARPAGKRYKPGPLDNEHCSTAYAYLYAGQLARAATLLDRDDPAERACSRWFHYRVVLKVLQGRVQDAEAVCRAQMTQDASLINMLVYVNLLQMRKRWAQILRFVHPRRDPTLSLIALRAMLRSYSPQKLRKQAIQVGMLSERNIGPGPEHAVLWRALYRPQEVKTDPLSLDWETW